MQQWIQTWWLSRQPREQLMVALAGLVLVLAMSYVLVWEPLQKSIRTRQQQVLTLRDDLQWMQQAVRQLPASTAIPATQANSTNTGTHNSVASLLEQSVRKQNLQDYVDAINSRPDNNANISFKAVPFDQLIRWLDVLSQRYALEISQLSLDQTIARSGAVNARILARGR